MTQWKATSLSLRPSMLRLLPLDWALKLGSTTRPGRAAVPVTGVAMPMRGPGSGVRAGALATTGWPAAAQAWRISGV